MQNVYEHEDELLIEGMIVRLTSQTTNSVMKQLILILGFFLFGSTLFAQPIHHHHLSESAFSKKNNHYRELGYVPSMLESYRINGKVYYTCTWREKKGKYEFVRKTYAFTMQKKIDKMKKNGYNMIAIDAVWYESDGSGFGTSPEVYCGVWEKGDGGQQIIKQKLPAKEYSSLFPIYVKKGYTLKHLSSFSVKSKLYFSCIWEKQPKRAFKSHSRLTPAQYQDKAVEYDKKGWYPTHISVGNTSKSTYFAVIWNKKGTRKVVARHHLSIKQYQEEFEKRKKQGYALQTISGYKWKGKPAFAAVWVKK